MCRTVYRYDETLANACKTLAKRWSDWDAKGSLEPIPMSSDDLKDMSPAQVQEFLGQLLLGSPLSCQTVKAMEKLYSFNKIQNSEIKFRLVNKKWKMNKLSVIFFFTNQMVTTLFGSKVTWFRPKGHWIRDFTRANEVLSTFVQVIYYLPLTLSG